MLQSEGSDLYVICQGLERLLQNVKGPYTNWMNLKMSGTRIRERDSANSENLPTHFHSSLLKLAWSGRPCSTLYIREDWYSNVGRVELCQVLLASRA